MTTVYTTVNGQILHEKRDGRETYNRPDTLGNVIATTSTTGTVRSTHTYWPYGEVRASTGTNHSPFKYVGTLGYYSDSATTLYVRARYYRPAQTRWMTVDPRWQAGWPYAYCGCSPCIGVDPTGEQSPGECFAQCMREAADLGLPKRLACYACKAQCTSTVVCESPSFDDPPGSESSCSKWFKEKWKNAEQGCIKACEAAMCTGLKVPFGPACKLACKSWCKDATGNGRAPAWGWCGNLKDSPDGHVGHACQDCCLKVCGTSGLMCADQCGSACCGGTPCR